MEDMVNVNSDKWLAKKADIEQKGVGNQYEQFKLL